MLIEHDIVQTRDVRLSGSAFHHQFLIRATAMMVSSRHHPSQGGSSSNRECIHNGINPVSQLTCFKEMNRLVNFSATPGHDE
jgi:hypothetical protein